MTAEQFADWIGQYRLQFLSPGDEYDFVIGWKMKLIDLEYRDLILAIADVAADPRQEARFPRSHCFLLIEHAEVHRAERERAARRPAQRFDKTTPPSTEAWDRQMLKIGAITPAEFAHRQTERGKSK